MNAILACLRCGGSFEGKFWLINSREYKCLQLTAHKNLLKFLYLYFLWSTIRKKIILKFSRQVVRHSELYLCIILQKSSEMNWFYFKKWKRGIIRLEGPLQVDKNVKKNEKPPDIHETFRQKPGVFTFINCCIIDPVRRVNQSFIIQCNIIDHV